MFAGTQPFAQGFSRLPQSLALSRRQIGGLGAVCDQIEAQILAAIARQIGQTLVPIVDHRKGRRVEHRRLSADKPIGNRLWALGHLARDQRQQTRPVDGAIIRHLVAHHLGDRWKIIQRAARHVHHAPRRGATRPVQQCGHAHATVEQRPLSPAQAARGSPVATVCPRPAFGPIVRAKPNHRILRHAQGLQRAIQPPDLIVHRRDTAVIMLLVLGVRRVHRPIRRPGDHRGVRRVKPDRRKKRRASLHGFLDKRERPIHQHPRIAPHQILGCQRAVFPIRRRPRPIRPPPGLLIDVSRRIPRRHRVFRRKRHIVIAFPRRRVIARGIAVGLARILRIQRAQVPLAKMPGGVAEGLQHPRQRDLLRRQVPAVGVRDAVSKIMPPGQARPPRWRTHRPARVKPRESNPIARQTIQIRRPDHRIPIKPHIAVSQIVAHHQNDIRPIHRKRSLWGCFQPFGSGWIGSTQYTSSGSSTTGISKLTTTGT